MRIGRKSANSAAAIDPQPDPLLYGQGRHRLDDLAEKLLRIDNAQIQFYLSVLHLADVQKILNHMKKILTSHQCRFHTFMLLGFQTVFIK